MNGAPVRWAELCCGSAAVTLRLVGGRRCEPPASYMAAVVAISEAEPIEIDGWHHVQIQPYGRRHPGSFRRHGAEWLTLSHPTAATPPEQQLLFESEVLHALA